MLQQKDTMLYSFDIFDTIITRKVRSPRGIFALVQTKLLQNNIANIPYHVANNFFQLRMWAEEQARSALINDSCQEVTLEEIYDCFMNMTQLNNEQCDIIRKLEIQTELENVLPIDENITLIQQLVDGGNEVILISDMYLSASEIRNMLLAADAFLNSIPLYVSSEYKKSKKRTDLFKLIHEELMVPYDKWTHYGDNQHSDVNVPKSLGINAVKIDVPDTGSWNSVLLEDLKSNSSAQLLMGAGARALKQRNNDDFVTSFQVGATICGPLFYPYILWVIDSALAKGISTLYFIARDGFLLKEIADQIITFRKLPIKTKYIYGSRKAWRLPSIARDEFDIRNFIKWNYPRLITSYQKIADIFEIDIEELQQFFVFPIEADTIIGDEIKNYIFELLYMEEDRIAAYIFEKNSAKRDRVKQYLQQELNELTEEHCAFVELIGSGSTQKCLTKLVSDWNAKDIETFYYRLDDHKEYKGNINYSFFSNKLPFGNIIEVLCGANHGQTLDYILDETGKWIPVFGRDEGEHLDAYGFKQYQNGLKAFTNEMLKVDNSYDEILMDFSFPVRFFKLLDNVEDEIIYDYIANMPYGIRGVDGEVTSFAPKLTDEDIKTIFYEHRDEPVLEYYAGYMLDYSLKRLDDKQKKLVDYYKSLEQEGSDQNCIRKNVHRNLRDLLGLNLVLYGAGKRGKQVYKRLITENETRGLSQKRKIIAWADRTVSTIDEYNGPVVAPEKIAEFEYDQVVITVASRDLAEEIKRELLLLHIRESQIIWINE